MSSHNIRSTVLRYLDSDKTYPAKSAAEIARDLGISPEDVNAFLPTAAQNYEVVVVESGSVALHPRLHDQFISRDSKNAPIMPAPPTVAWNNAAGWEKGFALVCSVVFLCVLLWAGLQEGEIPTRRYVILRTIMALAGAGFTIGVPGFITARIKIRNNLLLRAAGALAVFAVIYFFPAAT